MIKRLLAASACSLLFTFSVASAQQSAGRAEDEKAIRAVVAALSEAWTAGDARAWAAAFTEDADFTVWNGQYAKGREAIERGHQQIFSTIYRDTKHRMPVRSVRFLRDDVAVVHAEASVAKRGEEFPASAQVVPLFVMVKEKGQWRVSVFQNTSVQSGSVPPSVQRPPGASRSPDN